MKDIEQIKFLKRYRIYIGLLLILACSLLIAPSAFGEEPQVIRVGYPIQKGLTGISADGYYEGYTYDYLREIAQYTNWKYEFVTVEGNSDQQLIRLMEMLKTGEIDLMGGMLYSDQLAEDYDFSGYNYGTVYRTLSVLQENDQFYDFNFAAVKHIRVAVISSTRKKYEELQQFSEMNGFTSEQIFCDSQEEMMELLESGEADAALLKDISFISDRLRPICHFSPQPFYFAVTKGNRDVTQGLNMALMTINQTNPTFSTNLYTRYFGIDSKKLILSGSELAYIKESAPIRVAMQGSQAPIQYIGKGGNLRGISCDVLDYISQQTGLKFEIVQPENFSALQQLVAEQKVDMVAGLSNNYDLNISNNYTFTIPYVYTPLMLVYHKDLKSPEEIRGKRLALPEGIRYQGKYTGTVIYYSSIEDCIDAVNRGEVEYCYGNSYSIQYYTGLKGYKDLISIPQSEQWSKQLCFGIIRPADMLLLSVINKAIKSLPDESSQLFLYNNAFNQEDTSLLLYLKSNPSQTVTLAGFLIMLVALLGVIWYLFGQKRFTRQKALANARYEQLSEISNEFLYEYDIIQDCLKLTVPSADFLGCEKVIDHIGDMSADQKLFHYIASATETAAELKFLLPNGKEQWLRIISKTVEDEAGKKIYSVGKLVDIQQEVELKQELQNRAQRDSLTHVYNAETSRQKITDILSSGTQLEQGALFIMDIDYFKQVNDRLGHFTGDAVLQKIAEILKTIFRKEDIVGRLGGDEFLVYMRNTADLAVIDDRCKKIRERAKILMPGKEYGDITLSIGVALLNTDRNYDSLYQRADKALYIVKGQGRDGYRVLKEDQLL